MRNNFIYLFLFLFLIGLVSSDTGKTSSFFYTGSGGYVCRSDDTISFWQNVSDINDIVITSGEGAVFGGCNMTEGEDWCCPTGYKCELGLCTQGGSFVDDCTDLMEEDSCNFAPGGFSSKLIDALGEEYVGACSKGMQSYFDTSGNLCGNVTYCRCSWRDKACTANLSFRSSCGGGVDSFNSCSWAKDGEAKEYCDENPGKIIVEYTHVGDLLNPACEDRTVEYPCSVSVQLPFFNGFNFIISIIAIVGIYFVLGRRSLNEK